MAPSSRALRELEWLVRCAEPGMANISAHLVQHFDELRAFLPGGITRTELVGVPDEQLVSDLERRLHHRAQTQLELRQQTARERAQRAAMRLAQSSRQQGDFFLLDVPTLLGDLLADRRVKQVLFEMGERARVAIPLRTLVNARQALGKRHDLVAFADEHGLHFRWKEGRGGLRFQSQPIDARSPILVVELGQRAPSIPTVEAPSAPPLVETLNEEPSPMPAFPTRPSPTRSARPTRRGGSWLHEILSNLGF